MSSLACLTEEDAKNLILFARNKKYLLKGPFKENPINNYIRITTGPLSLMQAFWRDCSEGILEYSLKTTNSFKENIDVY